MKFTKMHGAGNDYVYLDCFANPAPADPSTLAIAMADRNKGIGGDGLILIQPSEVADARMRMFNADGSESEMCGNGLRCVGKYVHDHDICRQKKMKIETGAGVLELDLQVDGDDLATQITVDMGLPILEGQKIPTTSDQPVLVNHPLEVEGQTFEVTCVSMGNPHCVIFVPKATDELVLGVGPKIETHPFFPNRTNVEFVEVVSKLEVKQRTWERGSGETLACGTGASAVCVAGVLTGKTENKILNHLLGGDLTLQWSGEGSSVIMTGPATEVFSGEWNE